MSYNSQTVLLTEKPWSEVSIQKRRFLAQTVSWKKHGPKNLLPKFCHAAQWSDNQRRLSQRCMLWHDISQIEMGQHCASRYPEWFVSRTQALQTMQLQNVNIWKRECAKHVGIWGKAQALAWKNLQTHHKNINHSCSWLFGHGISNGQEIRNLLHHVCLLLWYGAQGLHLGRVGGVAFCCKDEQQVPYPWK